MAAQVLTDAKRIFWERPMGPDWHERLATALKREAGVDWIGPCPGEKCGSKGDRAIWWVQQG